MKQFFFGSILMLVVVASPVSVAAQTQRNTGASARETAQEQVQQRRSTNLTQIATVIHGRLENHAMLFENFITRLESRRAKLAESGADTSELDSTIRLIKTDLASLKSQIAALKTSIANFSTDESISSQRLSFRSDVNAIREGFRSLHQAMVQAVRLAAQLSN